MKILNFTEKVIQIIVNVNKLNEINYETVCAFTIYLSFSLTDCVY